MIRTALIVGLCLLAACSGGDQKKARWTANCDTCSWRTSGLTRNGVDRANGDRCPNPGCRGRLVVRVLGRDTTTEMKFEAPREESFGLDRYDGGKQPPLEFKR